MTEPQAGKQYADSSLLETVIAMYLDEVQAGNSVPLTKDGELVAMIVSPEIARAGMAALGREA